MPATGCDACIAKHKGLCSVLSRDELSRLGAVARRRRFAAGQTIVDDQQELQYLANVLSGVIKLTKTLVDGREQIVGLQFPADFVGRPLGGPSSFRAEAAIDVELCTFARPRFEQVMREVPGVERRLLQHTLDALDTARAWMVLLGRKTATEKVASFLLILAQRFRGSAGAGSERVNAVRFELPLTRGEMADFLGLTIETVSRNMTRLRSIGVIRLEGMRTVILPDIKRLVAASECPTEQGHGVQTDVPRGDDARAVCVG